MTTETEVLRLSRQEALARRDLAYLAAERDRGVQVSDSLIRFAVVKHRHLHEQLQAAGDRLLEETIVTNIRKAIRR